MHRDYTLGSCQYYLCMWLCSYNDYAFCWGTLFRWQAHWYSYWFGKLFDNKALLARGWWKALLKLLCEQWAYIHLDMKTMFIPKIYIIFGKATWLVQLTLWNPHQPLPEAGGRCQVSPWRPWSKLMLETAHSRNCLLEYLVAALWPCYFLYPVLKVQNCLIDILTIVQFFCFFSTDPCLVLGLACDLGPAIVPPLIPSLGHGLFHLLGNNSINTQNSFGATTRKIADYGFFYYGYLPAWNQI